MPMYQYIFNLLVKLLKLHQSILCFGVKTWDEYVYPGNLGETVQLYTIIVPSDVCLEVFLGKGMGLTMLL